MIVPDTILFVEFNKLCTRLTVLCTTVLDILNQPCPANPRPRTWVLFQTITTFSVGKGEQHTAWVFRKSEHSNV
jgi:hypothetical protein